MMTVSYPNTVSGITAPSLKNKDAKGTTSIQSGAPKFGYIVPLIEAAVGGFAIWTAYNYLNVSTKDTSHLIEQAGQSLKAAYQFETTLEKKAAFLAKHFSAEATSDQKLALQLAVLNFIPLLSQDAGEDNMDKAHEYQATLLLKAFDTTGTVKSKGKSTQQIVHKGMVTSPTKENLIKSFEANKELQGIVDAFLTQLSIAVDESSFMEQALIAKIRLENYKK